MALFRGRGMSFLTGGAIGALLAYLFDPARGRARRHQVRDRASATARRGVRRAGRTGRYLASDAQGLKERLAHRAPEDTAPNDPTLAHAVESRLFQDADVPKGRINVSAEGGVVVLRGVADTPDQIKDLEKRARKVPGVMDVENLLHLPGTPAPNKDEAREASRDAAVPQHTTG
jgi:osmotically-inducible protein OsmY